MKSTVSLPFSAALALAFTAITGPSTGFGQGELTPPPGPPAPTMKTLEQIEARTIVNAANTPGDATHTFIITAPGSYYLTGNLTGAPGKNGIGILANNVTLDLNGFALISGGGATRGVNTTIPVTNFCIRNGNVRGWTDGGVRADAAVTLAEKLLLADNTGATGLTVGNGSMVKDCVASGNATGFFCGDRTQISNCISSVNTGAGFDCTSYVNLLDCTSSRNAGNGFVVQGSCSLLRCSATRNFPGASGIVTGVGCIIADCTAANNALNGITAGAGSTIRNCTARANTNDGIYYFGSNCYVVGNTCDSNTHGIFGETGTKARLEGNSCTSNVGYGLAGAGLVIRNSARGNGVNFNVIEGGAIGPIVDLTAGGTITSTSPWANISY